MEQSKEILLTNGGFVIVDAADFKWLNQWKWREIGEYTDHINRNRLDNRRCNLRKCTLSQNMQNRVVLPNNKAGFKGVHWCGPDKKWQAQIYVGKKRHYLGKYKDKHDAARAYNKAALELHGEFACINKVDTRVKNNNHEKLLERLKGLVELAIQCVEVSEWPELCKEIDLTHEAIKSAEDAV